MKIAIAADHAGFALKEKLRQRLAGDGYAFGSLVEEIVTGPQFLNKRGLDEPRAK